MSKQSWTFCFKLGENMKTVGEEIYRLYDLCKDANWSINNVPEQAIYYSDLLSVHDNDMTLDKFYKLYPYHNPDINIDYWNQQHNKWKEIWKQNTI